MKRILITVLIGLFSVASISAQAAPAVDTEGDARRAREAAFDNRVDRLRNVGKERIIRDRYGNSISREKFALRYRDLTKDEESMMAPDPRYLETYSKQLEGNRWGVTKLIIDKGCGEETEVVVSSEHCLKYQMPGAGAAYSFREKKYRLNRLADIRFTDKGFETSGGLKHGILIAAGDLSLDFLERSEPTLVTLVGFQPSSEFEQAENFSALLGKGIQGADKLYRSWQPAEAGVTYVVRSIAYRISDPRRVDDVTVNEIDLDRRRDILVAFRALAIIPNETVTIAWKILEEKSSPKLKRIGEK